MKMCVTLYKLLLDVQMSELNMKPSRGVSVFLSIPYRHVHFEIDR